MGTVTDIAKGIVFLASTDEATAPPIDTGAVDQGAVTLLGRDGTLGAAVLASNS
jgi:hypothetical protein